MKFMLLVYADEALMQQLPEQEFNKRMRGCLAHADELRQQGKLLDSQMLQQAPSAKSVRVRNGRQFVMDGPFAETKELLAGFNLIEADDMEEALRIAAEFPWTETGCIEVRPVLEIDSMRQRVALSESPTL
jgi:hypothetical protein